MGALIATLLTAAVLVFGAWESFKGSAWNGIVDGFTGDGPGTEDSQASPGKVREEGVMGAIKVTTIPSGAEVYDEKGALVSMSTPTETFPKKVGAHLTYLIKKPGFKTDYHSFVVPESAAKETFIQEFKLTIDAPPLVGLDWVDQLDQQYRPIQEGHESKQVVGEEEWKRYIEDKKRPQDAAEFIEAEEGGVKRKIVLTSLGEAQEFCYWLAAGAVQQGYLTEQHEMIPRMQEFDHPGMSERARKENLKPFLCYVQTIRFAAIDLTTEPAGAEIFVKAADATFNNSVGRTNGMPHGSLRIDTLKPGETELLVVLEGYKPLTRKVTLGTRAGAAPPPEAGAEPQRGDGQAVGERAGHEIRSGRAGVHGLRLGDPGEGLRGLPFRSRVRGRTPASQRAGAGTGSPGGECFPQGGGGFLQMAYPDRAQAGAHQPGARVPAAHGSGVEHAGSAG